MRRGVSVLLVPPSQTTQPYSTHHRLLTDERRLCGPFALNMYKHIYADINVQRIMCKQWNFSLLLFYGQQKTVYITFEIFRTFVSI